MNATDYALGDLSQNERSAITSRPNKLGAFYRSAARRLANAFKAYGLNALPLELPVSNQESAAMLSEYSREVPAARFTFQNGNLISITADSKFQV